MSDDEAEDVEGDIDGSGSRVAGADTCGLIPEGAGGAVYKVRDRRTGIVMARKTITTLEAPMKQLLREIKIMSSTQHPNIIHFYGAYISPSSSEVKVLMEYGEGGSLESVGKQMKQIGGRVSEKVAGRLAEGVRAHLVPSDRVLIPLIGVNVDLARPGVPSLPEDHSQGHQTAERAPNTRRRCEVVRFWCVGRTYQFQCGHFHRHKFVHGSM